jgi:hypothetical protein
MLPSVPTLLRICLTLQITPDALMGFSPLASLQHAPGATPVPPGLEDNPDTRRLLRHLARLNRSRIQLLVKVAAELLAQR